MDKGSGIFVNDGSFMERFKQMQQENHMKESAKEAKSSNSVMLVALPKPGVILNKRPTAVAKPNPPFASGGKLAFSLKQKSKIVVAPVMLGTDDEDVGEAEAGIGDERAKRQKLGRMDAAQSVRQQGDVAHILSVHQSQWKELLIERNGNCGNPASNLHSMFKLLVLMSSLSDMQHLLPQVMLQWE